MVDQWRHVQMVRNPVTTKLLVYKIPMRLSIVLDNLTDLIICKPWFAGINCHVHCFSCNLRKTFDFIRNFDSVSVHHYHRRVVSMMTFLVANDVNIHVVPGFQNIVVRHTMGDHIID